MCHYNIYANQCRSSTFWFSFLQLQSTEESYRKSLEASESRNMDLESTLIKLEEEQQR